MKLGLACDHGGYELKEILKDYLADKGYEIIDYGTNTNESVDYPDYAAKLAKGVLAKEVDLGIAICGTGIGISIACNKFNGIGAAHVTDAFSAEATRKHNDANILCLGGRITGVEVAKNIVDNFLAAEFEGGRHQNRLDKITKIEKRGE